MREYSLALAASKDYDDGYKLLELPLELSDIVTKELDARCSNRPQLSQVTELNNNGRRTEIEVIQFEHTRT